jgi:hypothetical protein
MWIEISRGMAALKSVWSLGSPDSTVETASTESDDLSGEFLAEAQKYMTMGRHQSAAILAGDALEAILQRLCRDFCIALPARPTVNEMNAKLVQAGVYNSLVEEQVEAMRRLWDNANAGLWSEVKRSAVESMMNQIRAFVGMHVAEPVTN